MSTETASVAQPSPFSESAWNTTPPTLQEPIVNENTEPTNGVVKDPVIEEKDKEIAEEKPTSDKPDEPLKIPAATPPPVQDLPEEKKKTEEAKPTAKIPEEFEQELYGILNQRQILKNLDKLPASEVIKLDLRNKNQEYTQQEIDDLFNERFSFPEKPLQSDLETDEDFAARENKYKEQLAVAERRIERESKSAKKELLSHLQELVLPDIPQADPEPKQPSQEELAALKKQREDYLQAVNGSLQKFTGYNATFKDKEVEIPIAYTVTDEEKESVKPLLDSLDTDLPQFFKQLNWLDKDGKLNMEKAVSDLHLITHKDEVIQKFVNEAGNKRNAETIKRQKNVDFSSQQRRGSLNPSVQEEVDKKVRGFFAAS